MEAKQSLQKQGVTVRRYDYAEQTTLAADFGKTATGTVDVVGDTVMIVADGEQYDVTVEDDAQAFMNNGVVTIEVQA